MESLRVTAFLYSIGPTENISVSIKELQPVTRENKPMRVRVDFIKPCHISVLPFQ